MARILQLATFKHTTVKRIVDDKGHHVVALERHTCKTLFRIGPVQESTAKTAYNQEVLKAKARG